MHNFEFLLCTFLPPSPKKRGIAAPPVRKVRTPSLTHPPKVQATQLPASLGRLKKHPRPFSNQTALRIEYPPTSTPYGSYSQQPPRRRAAERPRRPDLSDRPDRPREPERDRDRLFCTLPVDVTAATIWSSVVTSACQLSKPDLLPFARSFSRPVLLPCSYPTTRPRTIPRKPNREQQFHLSAQHAHSRPPSTTSSTTAAAATADATTTSSAAAATTPAAHGFPAASARRADGWPILP